MFGLNPSENIKMPRNKTFQYYIKHEYNFHFKNINEEIILSIIDKLAPKTSFGFDCISFKLIMSIQDAPINPLTLIINQMLNTGIFSNKLKIA